MSHNRIDSITARQILDSRGYPTVEAEVKIGPHVGRAAVPAGKSTGSHEAAELRDTSKPAYGGRGVLEAVANITDKIMPALEGVDPLNQTEVDGAILSLDDTGNKSGIGANAMLAVSLATAKAAAASSGQPFYLYVAQMAQQTTQPTLLPVPFFNLLNGGAHADGAVDIQEFMIAPIGADSFTAALRMGAEVFYKLKEGLHGRGLSTNVGDEGGFVASAGSTKECLELLVAAITAAGYQPGKQVALALDVAATELFDGHSYALKSEDRQLSPEEMIDWLGSLAQDYPIISIEDGLAEDDWEHWAQLNNQYGTRLQLVGDDLFTTNPERIQKGVEQKAANAVLIKPNQIGTLTETIQAVDAAHKAGWRTMMSHRSGETEDTSIAHLAVGLRCGQIKSGSLSRSERTAKYNELLRIESSAQDSQYAGRDMPWPI